MTVIAPPRPDAATEPVAPAPQRRSPWRALRQTLHTWSTTRLLIVFGTLGALAGPAIGYTFYDLIDPPLEPYLAPLRVWLGVTPPPMLAVPTFPPTPDSSTLTATPSPAATAPTTPARVARATPPAVPRSVPASSAGRRPVVPIRKVTTSTTTITRTAVAPVTKEPVREPQPAPHPTPSPGTRTAGPAASGGVDVTRNPPSATTSSRPPDATTGPVRTTPVPDPASDGPSGVQRMGVPGSGPATTAPPVGDHAEH